MAIVVRNETALIGNEEYISRLESETQRNFSILLLLLSSYWKSTIDGPNYARALKAIASSIGEIRLALDGVYRDIDHTATRAEYLYQVVTSMVFPDEIPTTGLSDQEFRDFLGGLVLTYFQGSIPDAVKQAMTLVSGGNVVIRETFKSSVDPADQFSFDVDVILDGPDVPSQLNLDSNAHKVLQIVRPAHTLFRLRYILSDFYNGNYVASSHSGHGTDKFIETSSSIISDYSYDDLRKFVYGVDGVDESGWKKSYLVLAEDHSNDW